MKKYAYFIFIFAFLVACKTTQLPQNQEKTKITNAALADSVLAYALDHEALYTLIDTLKPMSSVKFLRFAVAKDSTQKDGDFKITTKDSLLNKIEEYQKICQDLSKDDWQFIMMPFARTEKSMRNIEIYVERKSVLPKKYNNIKPFLGSGVSLPVPILP